MAGSLSVSSVPVRWALGDAVDNSGRDPIWEMCTFGCVRPCVPLTTELQERPVEADLNGLDGLPGETIFWITLSTDGDVITVEGDEFCDKALLVS